jgi:hypothetical protein
VEEAIAALQPGMKGIEFDTTLFRPATYIEMAAANLGNALLVGAILVVVALFAFLWNWRVVVISAIAILLSTLASVFVLYQRGATFNAMVLAGLVVALGVIIDDAIVDVDHIAWRLRQRRAGGTGGPDAVQMSPMKIIQEAASEMRGTMLFAMLIMFLVVVPVFFLEGISGALYQPLVTAYVIAVLVSMVVALLVTPALAMILLAGMNGEKLERRQSRSAAGYSGYGRVLARDYAEDTPGLHHRRDRCVGGSGDDTLSPLKSTGAHLQRALSHDPVGWPARNVSSRHGSDPGTSQQRAARHPGRPKRRRSRRTRRVWRSGGWDQLCAAVGQPRSGGEL